MLSNRAILSSLGWFAPLVLASDYRTRTLPFPPDIVLAVLGLRVQGIFGLRNSTQVILALYEAAGGEDRWIHPLPYQSQLRAPCCCRLWVAVKEPLTMVR